MNNDELNTKETNKTPEQINNEKALKELKNRIQKLIEQRSMHSLNC